MKVVVKGWASVSMDALVQQTESPLIAGVLHFPLPAKFRMPQIEMLYGTKDPIDHLNTYKNQMELNGCQEPNSSVRTGHVATKPSSSRAQQLNSNRPCSHGAKQLSSNRLCSHGAKQLSSNRPCSHGAK